MITIFKEANQFYPQYLAAHSHKLNRVLNFIGVTQLIVFSIVAFIFKLWLLIPFAIFIAYLLPGIGHRYVQHNDSFRSTKPFLCIICAARLFFDTLFFLVSKKMKTIIK